MVVIAVAGVFLGRRSRPGADRRSADRRWGRDGAQLVQTMIPKASEPRAGIVATVIGLVTLLLGATGVMMELHDALNTVWKVLPAGSAGGKGRCATGCCPSAWCWPSASCCWSRW